MRWFEFRNDLESNPITRINIKDKGSAFIYITPNWLLEGWAAILEPLNSSKFVTIVIVRAHMLN